MRLTKEILEAQGWVWKCPLMVLKAPVVHTPSILVRLGWQPSNGRCIIGFGELPLPVETTEQLITILHLCGLHEQAQMMPTDAEDDLQAEMEHYLEIQEG